ncbi:MAG TPA: energy-coupling factor ABC transporter permease [Pirellulales bacterium]|nr:energy-coupling factor ABC transporter permease [Pirellulales bacterium]
MLLAMHIPDGFLDPATCLVTALISLAVIGYALRRIRASQGDRLVPLMGVMAAGIFAAQMVNVPLVGAQASGHLIGGVLAAVVLGPLGGAVALTAVLVVQCLLFGDGGVSALGANVLNMAVIGSIGGYWIYAGLRTWLGGPRGTVIGAVVASWLIIPISALTFALEMSAGGQVAFRPIATWMLFYHVLIGLGEAVVTGLVTAWLLRVRPDLIYDADALDQGPRRWGRVMAAGLTLGVAIAVFAAPFASELSDGLETVAVRLHFIDRAREVGFAPFPDYEVPTAKADVAPTKSTRLLSAAAVTTSLLGILGTFAAWGFALVVGSGARLGNASPGTAHAL